MARCICWQYSLVIGIYLTLNCKPIYTTGPPPSKPTSPQTTTPPTTTRMTTVPIPQGACLVDGKLYMDGKCLDFIIW